MTKFLSIIPDNSCLYCSLIAICVLKTLDALRDTLKDDELEHTLVFLRIVTQYELRRLDVDGCWTKVTALRHFVEDFKELFFQVARTAFRTTPKCSHFIKHAKDQQGLRSAFDSNWPELRIAVPFPTQVLQIGVGAIHDDRGGSAKQRGVSRSHEHALLPGAKFEQYAVVQFHNGNHFSYPRVMSETEWLELSVGKEAGIITSATTTPIESESIDMAVVKMTIPSQQTISGVEDAMLSSEPVEDPATLVSEIETTADDLLHEGPAASVSVTETTTVGSLASPPTFEELVVVFETAEQPLSGTNDVEYDDMQEANRDVDLLKGSSIMTDLVLKPVSCTRLSVLRSFQH